LNIDNPEVRIVAGLSQALETDYLSEGLDWIASPFAWIKTRPSRQVGAIVRISAELTTRYGRN
jgi:hypothetical protein